MAASQAVSKPQLSISKEEEPPGDLQRATTPSVSGPDHSETNEKDLDEDLITRDKNYRPSIVNSEIKHDDPGLAISIDRYGFPTENDETAEAEAERKKRLRKENDRLVKWQQMLFPNKAGQMHQLSTVNMLEEQIKQWNHVRAHKKLKTRIRKGIPQQLRATVWQNLAGARELQQREQKKHGKRSFYNELVRKNKSPYHDQLWKDINRTYRKQVRFGMVGVKLDDAKENDNNNNNNNNSSKKPKNNDNSNGDSNGGNGGNGSNDSNNRSTKIKNNNSNDEKSNDKNLQLGTLNKSYQNTNKIQTPQDLEKHATDAQMQLYNVLKAFSLYREDIGYCQGMQSVSALMLMLMTEEETFWMLAALADDEKYRMELLWRPDMPAMALRFFQTERLVMIILPKLAAHFKNNNIESASMYQATQWFITIFLATNMQFDTVLRVWDIYLNEGLKTIFRMGIGFLKYYEKELLKSSFEEMHEIFREGPGKVDTEKYINICFSFKITHAQLDALERQFNQQEQEAQQNAKAKSKGKKGKK